ncbi:hypothetical protein BDV96DRAFT_123159 [Lophiotrema nucula]|uniref:Uncharacterized protein n=1 Tax=Lophiotrema nucula TaxID=690887 RepID=A0A6A5Z3C9_9PLEO|nr:hypothetical protein BDV96DRAFT_123159 [Lophiotrema nucula]
MFAQSTKRPSSLIVLCAGRAFQILPRPQPQKSWILQSSLNFLFNNYLQSAMLNGGRRCVDPRFDQYVMLAVQGCDQPLISLPRLPHFTMLDSEATILKRSRCRGLSAVSTCFEGIRSTVSVGDPRSFCFLSLLFARKYPLSSPTTGVRTRTHFPLCPAVTRCACLSFNSVFLEFSFPGMSFNCSRKQLPIREGSG